MRRSLCQIFAWLVSCVFVAPWVLADEPVGRTKAAAIAQAAYGGKVLSVDEPDSDPTAQPGEEPAVATEAHYVVKLLQTGGRIKVIHLDANGNIL